VIKPKYFQTRLPLSSNPILPTEEVMRVSLLCTYTQLQYVLEALALECGKAKRYLDLLEREGLNTVVIAAYEEVRNNTSDPDRSEATAH